MMTKRMNHDEETLADEEPAADPSIFDGPYDPTVAMYLVLENYREMAKAKAMWKASLAETKDLKDAYEELVDRHQALLEGFDKQKHESFQPTLKPLDDDE
jgi:hypothetical protein